MIRLSSKWLNVLASQPETGLGYHIVTVVLKNGRRIDHVAVVEGNITEIRGRIDIPFAEDDIAQLVVTHERWDFNAKGPSR
jgi:hypothetical protein